MFTEMPPNGYEWRNVGENGERWGPFATWACHPRRSLVKQKTL